MCFSVFFLEWTFLAFVDFFFSSRRRHTRWNCDWSSDVCSSDLDQCRSPAIFSTTSVRCAAKRCSAGYITSTPCALRELRVIFAHYRTARWGEPPSPPTMAVRSYGVLHGARNPPGIRPGKCEESHYWSGPPGGAISTMLGF